MLKHLQARDDWSQKSLTAKGFTLVELLVVIVILGILAAVVVFSVSGIQNNAQANACKTEKRTLDTAVEAYYAKEGGWPGSVGALETAGLVRPGTISNHSVGSGGTVTGTGKCA